MLIESLESSKSCRQILTLETSSGCMEKMMFGVGESVHIESCMKFSSLEVSSMFSM